MNNNITSQNTANLQDQEEEFSLRDLWESCMIHWKWFAISVILFCALGLFYILRQQPVYHRQMTVLVQDQKESNGGVGELAGAFSSMGIVSTGAKVNNELISLTSPAVMYEVVSRLGLDVNYSAKGRFHSKTLYGNNLPVIVRMPDIDSQMSASFKMTLNPDGTYKIEHISMETEDGFEKSDKTVTGRVSDSAVSIPLLGQVTISANPILKKPLTEPMDLHISRMGMQNSVERYSGMLKGSRTDKDADAIDLSIDDVSIQRAVDVLNTVLLVYNELWVEDKNKLAIATSHFIDDRLRLIQGELNDVDKDISDFKSTHRIPDLQEAARQSLVENTELSREMLELNNELSMAKFVRDYLNNPANINNVIPVNTGMGSAQLEQQLANYNTTLLSRNSIAQNSSASNPLVIDYDNQLAGMRSAIDKAINARIESLNKSLGNMQGAKNSNSTQLAEGPTQAKHLLSLERQQKVKESLYLYLLQKREENELSQTFTAYNTRVITPPMGSLLPVAPKKKLIMMVMFLLGVMVPGVWVYIKAASDTKVRSRKDLDQMSVPFAGEIPMIPGSKRLSVKKLLNHGHDTSRLEKVHSVVKPGSRDVVSESFRIVRGNLDFMAGASKEQGCRTIVITSFNPGSGKSFISYNLPASFALKGKKVAVIDGDLRHGSVSQFVNMPGRGISNYLNGSTDDWKSLMVEVKEHPGMWVMPIGHRPPNPSELLDNGRLGELIKEMRQNFDVIFIDCPPVDVVVDTQIINRYTDSTIFVVRAGLLERSAVVEIDKMYKDSRFNSMCIVLNGTEYSKSHYHAYGGGYYHDNNGKGFK